MGLLHDRDLANRTVISAKEKSVKQMHLAFNVDERWRSAQDKIAAWR